MTGSIFLAGGIIGALAGWAWHRAHRTWKDWRRAVASAAALRRLFWRHGFQGVLWGVGALAVLWVIVR